jgi:hypothetical protein
LPVVERGEGNLVEFIFTCSECLTLLDSAVPIPGFTLILGILRIIHTSANQLAQASEESKRLKAYCSATALSILKYKELKLTEETLGHLDAACAALNELDQAIKQFTKGSDVEKFFSGKKFSDAAKTAQDNVEQAMNAVMQQALRDNMKDVETINEKVKDLLLRRCFPTPLTPGFGTPNPF